MQLKKYIEEQHCGNQSAFAAAQGVHRQQVQQWMNKKFIVVGCDGDLVLYSPRRTIIRSK